MILFEHLYIYFYIENNVYTVKSKRREPGNPPPGNRREGRESPESRKKVPDHQEKIRKNGNSEK
jgi:hypothetical protein